MDLPNGKVVYETLSKEQSKIKLFYISENEIEDNETLLPEKLETVRGTMKIHQIFTDKPGNIKWRILSCFCSAPEDCECYDPQTVYINQDEHTADEGQTTMNCKTDQSQGTSLQVGEITEGLIGHWCVVLYDGDAYPGIIQDVDSESSALVKTMSRIGANRFFWPMRDDILWYRAADVLGLVPEPQPVTKRHMMLDASVWKQVCSLMEQKI